MIEVEALLDSFVTYCRLDVRVVHAGVEEGVVEFADREGAVVGVGRCLSLFFAM